jgi:phage terminase small subunit
MKATSESLTPKQELLLVALLATGEAKRAAEQAGVSETSAWRWLQTEAFQTRYRQARRQLVEVAMSQLQADCGAAARVLREVAEDASVLASSRVAAAKTILELSIKAVELSDLAERVARLEELLAEQEKGKVKRWA